MTYADDIRRVIAAVQLKAASFKKRRDPFATRAEWEAALQSRVSKVFRSNLDHLLELLGDPPQLDNIPASFWENGGKVLRNAFEITLMEAALDRAEQFLEVMPLGGVEWDMVNQAAADWARDYSYELVKGINDVTRAVVQKEVERFYADGATTVDDVAARLAYYFSPERAQRIAVTEITRAAVAGERAVVAEIEKFNIRMQPIWQTAGDDIAADCEVCGPKDGKPIEGKDYPPAHVNCRCGVTYEIVRDNAND